MRGVALYITLSLVLPAAIAQSTTPVWKNGSQEMMCGLGTYHDSLDLAIKNATAAGGDRLVTVLVLPSFQREYAMVLKQVGSEVRLLRATLQEQLWSQLGALEVPRTRQQCLDRATAAKVETINLSVRPETTQQLWTVSRNISLDTGTCPRQQNACALIADGTGYVVQTKEGRALRLTEIGNFKDMNSENAALLDWIHALLQTAKDAQPH